MKKIKKKVIVAVVCVIAVWLIMGIVDFALVRSYHRPLFCVCTEPMQDGGSGKYVGFGYSFDIEGNFMPDTETPATEDKKPKVTSYRGYIFGKEVSRGFWDEMLPTPYKSMHDVIENAPSLLGNVTEVHETYMIIHFVTSGYPYGADCSVSLTPVYGDSYTDVSVGDEVVVYYDGNIMETDPLQLGTVYAITLRTPANRNSIEGNSIAFSELAPGQEEKYATEYYAFTDDAWLDYSVTYERAAMTLVIGLRAEDGTEYSKEITGGDEKGTITGIPAGTYEVFVRSSESNADYEDTTIESLNVTGAMNFVAGQRLPEDMPYSHSSFTPETNESITVEYLGAGQIKKWSVSAELIDDVMEWYADLDYKKVTFKEGESPADGEGQTVYDIVFSDSTNFAYYDCGTEHYIRMDGIWYKVKNPKLPPVGEPV